MEVFEVRKNQKKSWDEFVLKNGGSFLQSWQWGEFKKAMGYKVMRLAIIQEAGGRWQVAGGRWQVAGERQATRDKQQGDWLAVAQVIKMPLALGRSYFYVARGPILKWEMGNGKWEKTLKILVDCLGKVAQKQKAIFLRIEPEQATIDKRQVTRTFQNLGFKKLRFGVQPENTLILDLKSSEKELLKRFRNRARYNINRAKRMQIASCRLQAGEQGFNRAFEEFWSLIQKTAQRQQIKIYSQKYYQKLFEILQDKAQLFVAYYQEKPIVANIVIFWGKRATYLYGASAEPCRTGASYFLQWQQILEAKKRNLTEYDFWGIAIENKKGYLKPKKWTGITFFKRAFDGKIVKYLGIFDYPFDKKWYLFYKIAKFWGLKKLKISGS